MLALRKMFDDCMAKGGRKQFRSDFKQLLGIQKDRRGVERLVPDAVKEGYQDYDSLLEIACEMSGQTPRNTVQALDELYESEGGIIDGSGQSYISGATDVIGGLIQARILDRYNSPEWLAERFCTMEPITNQDGGYRILPSPDENMPGDNLTNTQPYPSMGARATRVHNLMSRRQGAVVEVSVDAIKLDLTGLIVAQAEANADKVLYQKELRVADCVMGIGTSTSTDWLYHRDGIATYPYRSAASTSAAGVSPETGRTAHAYLNTAAIPLVDYHSIQQIEAVLGQNKDPVTNLEIDLGLENFELLIAPTVRMDVRAFLHATEILNGTSGASGIQAFPMTMNRSPNPLDRTIPTVWSWRWFNRLRTIGLGSVAGQTAADTVSDAAVPTWSSTDTTSTAGSAAARYWYGNFKRALVYREFTPFRSFQAPLALPDLRRSVAVAVVIEERGTPTWVDPRYVFAGRKA